MKITTFNVNGIRAIVKKEGLDWIYELDSDVLGLQEIKAKPEQVPAKLNKIADYQVIWNSAERPGYSGTAVFYRDEPRSVSLGIDYPMFDEEGRVICLEYPDFFVYNIYFPNGGEENRRVPEKLQFYAKLLEETDELHKSGKKVIITGDFNTAHREIDLEHPAANSKTTGFLPEERAWIDKYLEHNFVDAFRQLYPDREKAYTWWSYRTAARLRNVGWRLDYYLISKVLKPRVQDVIIHDDIMGSDHCPVSMILKD
ncbi:MAG TPA: exodeoxyribonuclease III [Anaerolineaceae bacterium]|nr:exodeoxyribonuclease III [Anaerolineaceae bacterium]